MKLKSKILKDFIVVAVASVLVTMISLSLFFSLATYSVMKDDIKDYGKAVAAFLESSEVKGIEHFFEDSDNYGIIVADENGEIIYDNGIYDVYEQSINAVKNGQLELKAGDKYCYCQKLESGEILIISQEMDSFLDLFNDFIPVTVSVTLIIIAVCVIISSKLTRGIVKPIEEMAINMEKAPYDELVPFTGMIKEQRQKLDDQMQRVLEAGKIRRDFTANVSHELKTPLTSISGYAEMIENGMARPEDMQVFGKRIHRESMRLLRLIEDILKISQLESNQVPKDLEDVDIYELCKECRESLDILCEKYGVSIDLKGQTAVIKGNRDMLHELIYNLCDNGIRYNHPGGKVFVTIKSPVEKDGVNGVNIIVEDNGIGIDEKHLSRIFERFYRVDKSRSKQTGGTGLGLAIVKHICEQYNGAVSIQSTLGKGTTITVFLPYVQ